ncbi:MAG: DUF2269 family protein [Dehalococcoidia bacterium]
MNAVTIWHFLHILSVLWMGVGIGAVMLPVYRSWRSQDLQFQMAAFRQAADNETGVLLPGALLTGATGVGWGAAAGWNFFTDGWLLALWLIYVLMLFACVPLLGLGLRRARLLSLQAAKTGKVTPELEAALADNVPLVFGTLIIILMVVIVWLAVFKPF